MKDASSPPTTSLQPNFPGFEKPSKRTKPPLRASDLGILGLSVDEYRRRVATLPKLTKAISIKQPWAWLITRPDITDPAIRSKAIFDGLVKDFENRDWPENHPGRKFRGEVLIHASLGPSVKKKAMLEYDEACRTAKRIGVTIPAFDKLERGGIVGRALVHHFCDDMGDDERDDFDSEWRFSSGFRLGCMEPLPFVPCVGMLGFFNPVFQEVTPDA